MKTGKPLEPIQPGTPAWKQRIKASSNRVAAGYNEFKHVEKSTQSPNNIAKKNLNKTQGTSQPQGSPVLRKEPSQKAMPLPLAGSLTVSIPPSNTTTAPNATPTVGGGQTRQPSGLTPAPTAKNASNAPTSTPLVLASHHAGADYSLQRQALIDRRRSTMEEDKGEGEGRPDSARAHHERPRSVPHVPLEQLQGLDALKGSSSSEGSLQSPPQSPTPADRAPLARARPRRGSNTVKRESIKSVADLIGSSGSSESDSSTDEAYGQSSWEKKLAESNVRTRSRKASHIVKRNLDVWNDCDLIDWNPFSKNLEFSCLDQVD